MNRALLSALRKLAEQAYPGPNSARLEAMVDAQTNDVLQALAAELAGRDGNPRTKRSAAARELLKRGAAAMLADASQQA